VSVSVLSGPFGGQSQYRYIVDSLRYFLELRLMTRADSPASKASGPTQNKAKDSPAHSDPRVTRTVRYGSVVGGGAFLTRPSLSLSV
jgi:hypothetical protein